MKNSNLLPVTALTAQQLLTDDGDCKVKYLKGFPRQYRFDASKGLFNLNGEQTITLSKQPFRFVPLAYRVFKASLFNYPEMNWTEFFFLNADLQVCSTLFHEFSTQSFLEYANNHLFYAGVNPCEVMWTVTPNEKTNVVHGSKYYIASFHADEMDGETKEAMQMIRSMIAPIFRQDTVSDDCDMIASVFYHDTATLSLNTAEESKADKLDRVNDLKSKRFAKGVVGNGVTI